MMQKILYSAAALLLAALPSRAMASTVQINFAGGGVNGALSITYGPATDATYPMAFEVTNITGTFTDANKGIFDAAITGVEPVNHAQPEPTNLLAPSDFSRFPVAVGTAHGSLNYDNLFYPGGSPQTATDYSFHGGPVDIYGLLFDIGGGRVVNFWSNGVLPNTDFIDYGAAVATSSMSIDYVGSGVTITPEPGTLCLLGTGLLGAVLFRRLS